MRTFAEEGCLVLTFEELKGQLGGLRDQPGRVLAYKEAAVAVRDAARDGYVAAAPFLIGYGIDILLEAHGLEIIERHVDLAAAAAGRASGVVLVASGERFRLLASHAAAAAVFFGGWTDGEVLAYLRQHGYDLSLEEIARAAGYAVVIRNPARDRAQRSGVPNLFEVCRDREAAEFAAAVLAAGFGPLGYWEAEEARALADALAGAGGWPEVLRRLEEAAASVGRAAACAASGALAKVRPLARA